MLADQLVAWLLALVGELPEPEHDPAEVRDLADEIMSRPEYREPPESLLERIGDWVGDRLGDALSGLSLGGTLPQFVAWLILALLVGVVMFLLARSLSAGSWGRSSRRADRDAAVILSTDEHRSAADWLAEAARHEAEDRWAEGLLCRYRALVTQLVAREVIPELAGRTAGEYVQDVTARRPDVASTFAAATDLFEAAWYGGADTGPAERDRFATLAETTLSDVKTATPTTTPSPDLQGAAP
jgi:hypothetical protein